MDRQQYDQMKKEIESHREERHAQVEAEYQEQLHALNVLRDFSLKKTEHVEDNNGQKPRLRDIVEPIVDELNGDITQSRISERIREKHPRYAPSIQGPTISKVLRQLVIERKIEKTKDAHGKHPTVYKKL